MRVVALGTGQALDIGRRGDADVVFVHDRVAEDKFVAEGFGVERRDVMYNDFVLIGPKSDPAKVAGGKDVAAALKAIAAAKAPFVSRGDKSGTHAAELRYWKDAGVDPNERQGHLVPRDRLRAWARRSTPPSAMNAYILADRGTWLVVQEPRRPWASWSRATSKLFNQYGVILVNPAKHPHVKKAEGRAFIDWLVSRGRTGGDRQLQDRRRAAVLPRRTTLTPKAGSDSTFPEK